MAAKGYRYVSVSWTEGGSWRERIEQRSVVRAARSDEACFDCGGRGFITRDLAFVVRPRSLSTTGVTCLGAKITRPWCPPPPSPLSHLIAPRIPRTLVANTPPDPPLHLLFLSLILFVSNPFPQTKGPRGPSTSIFLHRSRRPPRGLVFRSGM